MGGGGWYQPTFPRQQPEHVPLKPDRVIPKKDPMKDMPLPGIAPPTDELAIHQYNDLRFTCHELEELIASVEGEPGWTEKDLKRLDKAVTVMKVGFKILKKVLNSRAKRHQLEEKLEPA